MIGKNKTQKQNNLHLNEEEIEIKGFIMDQSITIQDNLKALKHRSKDEIDQLINELGILINEKRLLGYQHPHRLNEFYLNENETKPSKSLHIIPWELTLLKLTTLSARQDSSVNLWHQLCFKNNPFLSELLKLQLSNLEITILTENLISFILGKGSVYLNEMGFDPEYYLSAYLSLRKGELKALELGLFRCVVESDNTTIRIDTTQKAVELFAGVAKDNTVKTNSYLPESIRKIETEEIELVDLILDSKSQAIFNVLERAIIKNQANKGISVLLHGPSGCGKTEFVMQLARQTDVPIYQLNMASIRSKWIGDTEKIATEAFRAYINACKEKKQIGILLMNEADGLLGKRIVVERGNDLHANQIQNTFLQLLEEFNGVLIATTNFPQNIDDAFKRRFLFWHEMQKPTEELNIQIIVNAINGGKIPEELATIIPSHGLTLAQMNKAIRQYNELKDYCSLEQISQLISLDFNENNQKRIGFAV
jgi:hypothetical protein